MLYVHYNTEDLKTTLGFITKVCFPIRLKYYLLFQHLVHEYCKRTEIIVLRDLSFFAYKSRRIIKKNL